MSDEALKKFFTDPLSYLKDKMDCIRIYNGHFRLGSELYNYMLYNDRSLSIISQKTGINVFNYNEYKKLEAIATFLGVPIRKDTKLSPLRIVFDCRSFDLKSCKKEEVDDLSDSHSYKMIKEKIKDPILQEKSIEALRIFRKLVREDFEQTKIRLTNCEEWTTVSGIGREENLSIPYRNNEVIKHTENKEEIIRNRSNNEHKIEDKNRSITNDSYNKNIKEEKEVNIDEYIRIKAIKICDECSVNIDYNKIQDKVNLLLKF